MGNKKTFDIKSVMDILYPESPSQDITFTCADEGNKKANDDEVIPFPEEDKDYSSFWRNKSKKS